MSSFLLLQQCPTFLVHLIWMVLEIGSRWSNSCCFAGCYFLDLFGISCSILVQFSSSFLSICLVSTHVVHPYSRKDMTAAWKIYLSIYQSIYLCIWIYVYIYTYIYIRSCLFVFYGTSTLLGYLIPNPVYTYLLDI